METTRYKQREIITINCGTCGVNLGQNILQQFACDHGISSSGNKEVSTQHDDTISICFEETIKGKYKTRSIFTDLDPYSINSIKTVYPCKSLIHSKYLIHGKSSACFNFATGYYKNKEVVDTINEGIRRLVEATDNFQGFLFNHSLSGGTGGGLLSLIFENISNNYKRKTTLAMSLLFDANRASCSMEIYNTMLSLHTILEYVDIDILFDNRACNNLSKNILKIQTPSYKNYNNLICKAISDITACSRFGKNETLASLYMDMIPRPRIQFLTTSIWPLLPRINVHLFRNDIKTLSIQCVNSQNWLLDVPSFDTDTDLNLAISFCYRGTNINEYISIVNESMRFMQSHKKIRYTEFNINKPMVKFVNGKAAALPSDNILVNDPQISMLINNIYIAELISDRILKPCDLLYANKCYIHNYIAQGMNEDCDMWIKAREDLGFLQLDYSHCVNDQCTDSEEDESY